MLENTKKDKESLIKTMDQNDWNEHPEIWLCVLIAWAYQIRSLETYIDIGIDKHSTFSASYFWETSLLMSFW